MIQFTSPLREQTTGKTGKKTRYQDKPLNYNRNERNYRQRDKMYWIRFHESCHRKYEENSSKLFPVRWLPLRQCFFLEMRG